MLLVFSVVMLAVCGQHGVDTAATDMGSCTTVTSIDVTCSDITADPNGCSTPVGEGKIYHFWTCPEGGVVVEYKCSQTCITGLPEPDECVGIASRADCAVVDYGTCAPIVEIDCGVGIWNVSYDCVGEPHYCPQLCCCKPCQLTAPVLFPQFTTCDDYLDDTPDVACLAPCPFGMSRRVEKPTGCYILAPRSEGYHDAQTYCEDNYSDGATFAHMIEVITLDHQNLVPLYFANRQYIGTTRLNDELRWKVDGRLLDETYNNWKTGQPDSSNCVTYEGFWVARSCTNARRFICQLGE